MSERTVVSMGLRGRVDSVYVLLAEGIKVDDDGNMVSDRWGVLREPLVSGQKVFMSWGPGDHNCTFVGDIVIPVLPGRTS